ncbi:hypothetical protein EJ063_07500 [Vibrio aquaticus]|uniref:Uncharacterized protein n=1 Tax=Vibrio aquaticus TaxID=2496559 RepID=A0A3S0N6B7_9VIBR|nr:hypothetical protein [Vibrio aquaticus]RTZ16632.1 hypothetical protein EJ063_07500 [Vibrio aquaticus]
MSLTTGELDHHLGSAVQKADDAVETFLEDHTGTINASGVFVPDPTGTLILSTSDSLELQHLMGEQNIAAQTSTSTIKSVKDAIMSSARNI